MEHRIKAKIHLQIQTVFVAGNVFETRKKKILSFFNMCMKNRKIHSKKHDNSKSAYKSTKVSSQYNDMERKPRRQQQYV